MNRHANSPIGLPDYLEEPQRALIVAGIRELWLATVGREPGDLLDDLESCKRWFDPVAQGKRLRQELADLPEMQSAWRNPGDPLTLTVGEGRFLVTPEGRCALDMLEVFPERPLHVIDQGALAQYDRVLAILYRGWGRHRLESVLELLQGTTKPLQIPAAGVLVALLVNRCTDESRALTRFAEGKAREVVDHAFFASIGAFKDVLAPDAKRSASPRLISGWMLYEAKRRVGEGLVVEDAKGGVDGRVWIRTSAVPQVIQLVARDLQRGHRTRPTADQFAQAFDDLVIALRSQLPSLAAYGLVHERPAETRRLRAEFLNAFQLGAD